MTTNSAVSPRRHLNSIAAAVNAPDLQEVIRRAAATAGLPVLPFLTPPLSSQQIARAEGSIILVDADGSERVLSDILGDHDGDRARRVIVIGSDPADAVRAFDLRAVDFILKPVDEHRLLRALRYACLAIRRFRKRPDTPPPAIPPTRSHSLRLLVKVQGRILVLPTERVDWIEAAGVYVRLHTSDSRPMIRRSLQDLERRLDPAHFVRIHRSAIINVERLHDLHPLSSGDFEVTLLDGTRLTLSRRYRHRVETMLGEAI